MKSIIKKTNESVVKSDKNGKNYKTVEFSGNDHELVDLGGGNTILAKREARRTSINRYEESYLPSANNAMEIGYDEAIGQAFLGAIVTSEVETPYEITNEGEEPRLQTTFTTVVFGDSESADWDTKVKQAFRSKGHPVKGDVQIDAIATVPLVKQQ